MVKNTEKTAEIDEFWQSDAKAIAERERVVATGFRMPERSSAEPDSRPSAASARVFRQTRVSPVRTFAGPGITAAFVLVGVAFAAIIGWRSQPVISLQEFEQLAPGMSRAACCEIVGAEPRTVFGVEGMPAEAAVISWKNDDGSAAFVAFGNDRVILKSQTQLK